MIEDCLMCQRDYPHRLHIAILANGTITFTDDDIQIEPPTTIGHLCGLCGKEVDFIDPEFGNKFCLSCSWMGGVP